MCSKSHWLAGRRQIGAGAGGVPDLGQVPQLDARIVAPALKPVVAVPGGEGSSVTSRSGPFPGVRSRQVPYPPGGPSRLAGVKVNPGGPGPARFRWFLGAGRAQPCPTACPSWSVTVTHQVALGVGRGGGGQVAGQPGIDRAEPGQLAGPSGQTGQGGQRDGQGDPPGEPARCRADRVGLVLAGAGVLVQEQVKQGAGTNRVRAAFSARPCAVRPPAR